MRQDVRCFLFVICLSLATEAESADPRTAGLKPTTLPEQVHGYQLSKAGGLTLEIAAGTAFCNHSLTHYNGGHLEMAANATNYIYLDTSANCVPAASAKRFSPGGAPIATVFTGPLSIARIESAGPASSAAGSARAGSTGVITSLDGLTASSQNFATGASGTDLNISSSGSTHTFNLPDASSTARGAVTTGDQTFAGAKTFSTPISPSSGGTGANNTVTAGRYLRANGTHFVTSSVAAGGAGGCAAKQFVTAANDNAAPTCAQPAFANLAGTASPGQLPGATSSAIGALQLATDLGGVSSSPKVTGLQGIPLSSAAPADGQIYQYNSSSRQWVPTTLGSGGGGTVTSVGLSPPSEFTVSGSPVTTSGTLTLSKANQSTNLIYAGPSSGAAAPPTFRSLVPADLPSATSAAQGILELAQDLSGSAAAPRVAGLQGNPVSSTTPAANQVLAWNGSAWTPATPSSGTVTSVGLSAPPEFTVSGSPVTTSGTLTLTKANQNAHLFYGGPSSGTAAAPAFRSVVAADLPAATATAQGALQLAQDLAGSASAPKVAGLQGTPVASTAPTTNQVLQFNGASWSPASLSSGAGTGACPSNQYVSAINVGSAPSCGTPVQDPESAPAHQYANGMDSTGWLTYAQPSFADLSGVAVPSQLPSASTTAQGIIELAQDLGGTAAAPKVVGLQGNPLSSMAPATNQVLQWNGSAWTPTTRMSGSGTPGTIGEWTGTSTVGNSPITDASGTLTSSEPFAAPSVTSTGAGTPTVQLGSSGPTWTPGPGAPTGSCTVGSLYSRTDGGASSTLYVCEGPSGTWAAK